MKIKRPLLKRYITILLDSDEIEKRRQVKLLNKLSDRKIYMAMIDALLPVKNEMIIEKGDETPDMLNNGIKDEMPPDGVMVDPTIIIEEE